MNRIAIAVLKWTAIVASLLIVSLGAAVAVFIYKARADFQAELESSRRKDWMSFDSIPKTVRYAVLAAEGARFFQCKKLSAFEALNTFSLRQRLDNGSGQGCDSSIPSQLARQVLAQEKGRGPIRLLKTLIGIYELRSKYSNRQIFEEYANRVYVGQDRFGLQDGALLLFHKPLVELTKDDAAGLAGILKAPSVFNPEKHHDRYLERKSYVIKQVDAGIVEFDQGTQ